MYDDNTAEVLRLQSPEELGQHRVYEFTQALALIEHSLNAMGLSLTDELPTTPVVPQSQEINHHEAAQNYNVVAEAEKITKEAVTDRVMNDVVNAYVGAEQNPLVNLEDSNA